MLWQDVLDRALSLAGEGDRLIENSHYAEDSIRPKCSELRSVCEEINSTLRSKKSLLLRAMELHHALEKVGKSSLSILHPQFCFLFIFFVALLSISFTLQALRWCEEGIFLLASQPVDRCQSQDGAEAALQELERYLDTAPLHTLADRSTVCCQYEAILTAQLMVRKMWIQPSPCVDVRPITCVSFWFLCFYEGPDRASVPEAKLGSGDVREETCQSEETGSQADQTSPASCSKTRSEIPPVFPQ